MKKNSMKTLLIFISAASLILGLTACGKNSGNTTGPDVSSASEDSSDTASSYKYDGNIEYEKTLADSKQYFSAENCELNIVGDKAGHTGADYTLMIYITGSNLESQYGNATQDLFELEEAGIDYKKTNVLAFRDSQ